MWGYLALAATAMSLVVIVRTLVMYYRYCQQLESIGMYYGRIRGHYALKIFNKVNDVSDSEDIQQQLSLRSLVPK